MYDDWDNLGSPLDFSTPEPEFRVPTPVPDPLPVARNPQLLLDVPIIHPAPLMKIEYALAMVGIRRLGVAPFTPRFSSHERRFDVFSTGHFLLDDEWINRIDVPSLGAETLSAANCTSMAVGTATGCLVWGQSTVNHVIGGVREKLDGNEVVQFVVHTSTRKVAFIFDVDRVWQVTATKPAVYERVGNVYNVLIGDACPEVNSRVHQWNNPVREELESLVDKNVEGVVLNINGLDYRVKATVGVTLHHRDGVLCDANGRKFFPGDSIDRPPSYGDYNIVGNKAYFIRSRPDKTVADSSASVDRSLTAPKLAAIVSRFPSGRLMRCRVKPEYRVPRQPVFGNYVSDSFNQNSVGPYAWANVNAVVVPTTGEAVIRNMVAEGADYITPELIMVENNSKDRFLVGQNVKYSHPQHKKMRRIIDGVVYANYWFPECTGAKVICDGIGDDLNMMVVFADVAPVVSGKRNGLLLFYQEGGCGNGPGDDDSPGDGIHARMGELIEKLTFRPSSALSLSREMKLHKSEINSVLYGRPDLFAPTKGTSPPIWRMLGSRDNG